MVEGMEIRLSTKGRHDIIDITGNVENCIQESKINNGTVTIFAVGSTTALTTIEHEPGLCVDMKDFLEKIIPYNNTYAHHERWGCDNGSSHIQSALIKTSLVVPIIDKQLTLGTWQQIIFIELDTKARSRKIICQIMGE